MHLMLHQPAKKILRESQNNQSWKGPTRIVEIHFLLQKTPLQIEKFFSCLPRKKKKGQNWEDKSEKANWEGKIGEKNWEGKIGKKNWERKTGKVKLGRQKWEGKIRKEKLGRQN